MIYSLGEVMISLVDFKKEIGLWHSIFAVSDIFFQQLLLHKFCASQLLIYDFHDVMCTLKFMF